MPLSGGCSAVRSDGSLCAPGAGRCESRDALFELSSALADEPAEALFSRFIFLASAISWSCFAFAWRRQFFSSSPFRALHAFLSALYVSFACLRAAFAGSSAARAPKLTDANAAATRMLRTLLIIVSCKKKKPPEGGFLKKSH